MQDINLISQYIDIKDKKVFDIGCANGKFSQFFLDKGAIVFALDKIDNIKYDIKNNSNFSFKESNIDIFEIKDKFDIIFSRNVFSFCDSSLVDILNKIKNNLNDNGIIFFTYFGNHEEWGKDEKLKTLNRFEIDSILKEFKKDFDIKYFAEELFEGYTMSGDIKKWHIFRVVLKSKIG